MNSTHFFYLSNGDDKELVRLIISMQKNQINCNVQQTKKGLIYNTYSASFYIPLINVVVLFSRIFFHLFMWGLETNRNLQGHVWVLIAHLLDSGELNPCDVSPAITIAMENFIDARQELKLDCPNYDEYIQKLIACFACRFSKHESNFFGDYLDEQVEKRQPKFGVIYGFRIF